MGLLDRKFSTLLLTEPRPNVLQLCIDRPDKLNAMNRTFWAEYRSVFEAVNTETHFRVIVITGAGKHFTAGLDLADLQNASPLNESENEDEPAVDIARRAVHLRDHVKNYQETLSLMEMCRVPTIVAVHGACIGGGVDLCCSACIRYANKNSYICIQEVNVGLAADIGTLQKMPKLGISMSTVNEWAYTARKISADEALRAGFFSAVLPSVEDLYSHALETATQIAEKSPIAIFGTKRNLLYSRDNSVANSLEYAALWASAMLQTHDVTKAVMGVLTKQKPEFSKL